MILSNDGSKPVTMVMATKVIYRLGNIKVMWQ